MDETAILAELQRIARDVFRDPTVALTPETIASDVEGWNSLSHVTFIQRVEAELRVHFEVREIMRLRDVGALVALVARKLGT